MQKGIYEHYKGQRYELINLVKHSETEESLVLYRALYGERGLWVRPYSMFFENVTVGTEQQPRFRYVGERDE